MEGEAVSKLFGVANGLLIDLVPGVADELLDKRLIVFGVFVLEPGEVNGVCEEFPVKDCEVARCNDFNGIFSLGEFLFVEALNRAVFERETGVVNPHSTFFEVGVKTELFWGVLRSF